MQIDGMREFFSKIAPLNGAAGVQRNSLLSALPAPAQQTQPARDSVFLSDIGRKLSVNARESSSSIERQKTEPTDSLPPEAQKADKAMAKAIDILERMQKLAVAAQDKKLSDIDRVEMQIEIEDLRANLMAVPGNMRGPARPSVFPRPVDYGDYGYGDYSSVLGRMRERILNGEEWDVREAWCPDGFTRVTQDDNGEEVLEVFEAKAWYVVDDRNVLTNPDGTGVRDSGRKVSTVREILEWANPVVVMDAESAARGARYLEDQIAKIQKWREQLPANLEKFELEDAIAFLEAIAFPGGHHISPLTDPTHAGVFLSWDGIYDYRYNLHPMVLGGNDISLADGEIIKNSPIAEGWANENSDEEIVGHAGPKLREEYVIPLPLNEPEMIRVKGISLTK